MSSHIVVIICGVWCKISQYPIRSGKNSVEIFLDPELPQKRIVWCYWVLKHLTPQKLISIRQRFWVISKICKIVTIPATVKNPLKIPVGAAWFRSTPKSSLVLVSVTHPTLPKISSKFVNFLNYIADRQTKADRGRGKNKNIKNKNNKIVI